MQPEYRNILTNFELSKAEARTLYEARKILVDIKEWAEGLNCPCDRDLLEAVDAGIQGLNKANPRLNVDILVEED